MRRLDLDRASGERMAPIRTLLGELHAERLALERRRLKLERAVLNELAGLAD
jgi:hypothetical protein